MPAPGNPPVGNIVKTGKGRLIETRIGGICESAHEMWQARWIPQLVIKPSRARIRPIEDHIDFASTFRLRFELADSLKLLAKPSPIIERHIDGVEIGPSPDRNSLIA